MLERRHTVSLVERDRQRCERLADDLDAAIYRGDGTNVTVLEAAGTQGADVFMTVTAATRTTWWPAKLLGTTSMPKR